MLEILNSRQTRFSKPRITNEIVRARIPVYSILNYTFPGWNKICAVPAVSNYNISTAVWVQIQSSDVVTRPNITWYETHHCRNGGRILIRGWTHKRHMGCHSWIFWRKLTALQRHCIVAYWPNDIITHMPRFQLKLLNKRSSWIHIIQQ